MEQQTPESILGSLEKNLRPYDEAMAIRENSRRIKDHIKNRGFGGLAEDLNEMAPFFGFEPSFNKRDFEGSVCYPDRAFEEEYKKKHFLPLIGWGVLVPMKKWANLANKLAQPPTQLGKTIDYVLFQKTSLGLESTGISFHAKRDINDNLEYDSLYHESGLYSEIAALCSQIFTNKIRYCFLAQITFDHRIVRELGAMRAENMKPEEMKRGLMGCIEQNVENIPCWLNVPEAVIEQTRDLYAGVFSEIFLRIPRAVDAVSELKEKIGPMLTPMIFSAGSTEQDLEKEIILSPLRGICRLRDYVRSGDINQGQIKGALEKIGYH
ncbi:hypothetical protein COV19_00460 [Candidatus Woesearchaeota archaeon CG10_big_fil_rev_8_21_14_0_10_44_13]|nr:MAG: hypothetical protein COV19_00460 [Candidatus Woesearchaeota archaeon CG10_big_fil_rev_8_21_14_0_10_44_13]